MFKNVNERHNIECRENRREYRILPYAYIYITGSRKKEIPRVLGRYTYKIVRKEIHNVICKTKVTEN